MKFVINILSWYSLGQGGKERRGGGKGKEREKERKREKKKERKKKYTQKLQSYYLAA